MSCPSPCMWCIEKCCIKADKKYPHIRYKSPEQARREVKMPEVQQVPIKTIFQFQQQRTVFPVHPQVEDVITSQPRVSPLMSPRLPHSGSLESIPARLAQRSRLKTFPEILNLESGQSRHDLRRQTIDIPMKRSRASSLQIPHSIDAPTKKYSSRIRKASLQKLELSFEGECKSPSFLKSPRFHPQLAEVSESSDADEAVDSLEHSGSDTGQSHPTMSQSSPLSNRRSETFSTLHFSLYYDMQQHTLTVNLKEARNLPAKDSSGTSDPLVVMYLDPNKDEIFESKVVLKTLNPSFDQVFTFKKLLPDEVRRQNLVFRIYDHDRHRHSKNDFIGAAMLPLSEADLYGVEVTIRIDEEAKELRRTTKGYLLLSLTFAPDRELIRGVVLKATNLPKHDFIGGANPYVKIYLMLNGRRHTKWKTSVKKNTLLPVFNEAFKFDISNMEIKDISLEICVMDYERFSRNDVVGVVHIGESVEQETGRKHWTEMISSTHQATSLWHPILPQVPK